MANAAATTDGLLTTAKIAEKLGVSSGTVRKAIASLGIEPIATRGICGYYSAAAAKKIAAALK